MKRVEKTHFGHGTRSSNSAASRARSVRQSPVRLFAQTMEKLVEKSRPEGMENLENDMENSFLKWPKGHFNDMKTDWIDVIIFICDS